MIRLVQHDDELKQCAKMMAVSEPWITLKRDITASYKTISDPHKEVYIFYKPGKILGFIVINMQGAFRGYIQTICVAPKCRGKGIGTQLIEFAENRIFRDSPNVFICVSSFNSNAQKLYQRLGYQVVGELKNYISKGFSEILMRKSIAPLNEW